jgi:hypothetical protein
MWSDIWSRPTGASLFSMRLLFTDPSAFRLVPTLTGNRSARLRRRVCSCTAISCSCDLRLRVCGVAGTAQRVFPRLRLQTEQTNVSVRFALVRDRLLQLMNQTPDWVRRVLGRPVGDVPRVISGSSSAPPCARSITVSLDNDIPALLLGVNSWDSWESFSEPKNLLTQLRLPNLCVKSVIANCG